MKTLKWDNNYLSLAKEVSGWSKDPSTKIGAVAVGNKGQVLALGYNGFPRGVDDSDERLSNKDVKYSLVVHAELNCIYNATYNGASLDGATLYIYGLPVCNECAKGIIQTGIKRVVMPQYDEIDTKWRDSFETTKLMFKESGVEVCII